MGSITTDDGTQIYYEDWGSGPPMVLCHGRPLSSDAWEDAMFYFASRGYRCIAADRRGHDARVSRGKATTWIPIPTTAQLSSTIST